MKRRPLRHIVLATAACAAGLAIVAATGGTAGAAAVTQNFDCGIGGAQSADLLATAAATVPQNGTYEVTLAPNGSGTASGAEIKNMVTSFQAPTGSSIVAGSATATGGSGTLGAVSTAISGQIVQLKVPGPIANGKSFTNPTLKFTLKATGAVGTNLKVTFRQSASYTLTAAGSLNVTCNSTTLTTLTSTSIVAAATTTTTTTAPTTTTTQATTTSTTGATTTTTGGATTTTTKPPTTTTTQATTTTTQATTTTTPTTTTTAPPIITTQSWSPGTACGVPQTTTAPANAISVSITANGGKGGRSGSQASSAKRDGGAGGQAFGIFAVSPGDQFTGVVGCNGADGQNDAATNSNAGGYAPGGSTGNGSIVLFTTGAGGGGGGGASGVCSGANCSSGDLNALVVAGGGGGGGVSNCAGTPSGSGGSGGVGGSHNGDGGHGPDGGNGGQGGDSGSSSSSALGGAGGVNTDLAVGAGGNAPSTGIFDGVGVSVVGGGGGGGYAGGKQGQNNATGCKGAGGGGGGSSWVANSASTASFAGGTAASVTLTFTISTPAPTTTTTSTSTTSTTSTTQPTTTSTSTTSTTSTTQPTTTSTSTTSTTQPACAPDKVPFASVSALVTQQYMDFTGGPPTTAQTNQWVPAITNCSVTADSLIVSLLPTDQTTDDARLVRLYLAYFKRPPDPDGYAYWQRQLDAGKGLVNAALKFAQSTEFKRTYGSLNNSDFVELVYQNVLGRASEPTGKAFWVTRLDNKTKNRGEVMINFSESSENVTKKVNHVGVFRLFRTMMARFPSKTEYFALLDPITNNGKALTDAAKAIRLSAGYDARV